MRDRQSVPQWLPRQERAWVVRHQAVLEAIVEAFIRERQWPDPMVLERKLRAHGTKIGLLAATRSIPQSLGRRESDPHRVVLTLFGLACVPSATEMLEQYLAALRLALKRFDQQPDTTAAVLTRADVQNQLKLDDAAMDVLSHVILLPGNPFLAGGHSSVDTWEYEIDECIIEYEKDLGTVDKFISKLAFQRLVQSPPSDSEVDKAGEAIIRQLALVVGICLGAGANIIAVATAPLPLKVGVGSASLTAVVLYKRWPTQPYYVATVAIGALSAGLTWIVMSMSSRQEPSNPIGPDLSPGFTQPKCIYDVPVNGRKDAHNIAERGEGKIWQEFIAMMPYIRSLNVNIGINTSVTHGRRSGTVQLALLGDDRKVIEHDIVKINNNGITSLRFDPPVKVQRGSHYWILVRNTSNIIVSPNMHRYSSGPKPPGIGRTRAVGDTNQDVEPKDALVGCVEGVRRTGL